MHAKIHQSHTFTLHLTLPTIYRLMERSKNHYDATCRRASDMWSAGFLVRWYNYTEMGVDLTVTFAEMDLTLKLCESCNQSPKETSRHLRLIDEYETFIIKLLKESNRRAESYTVDRYPPKQEV